jgi:amino acid transporter
LEADRHGGVSLHHRLSLSLFAPRKGQERGFLVRDPRWVLSHIKSNRMPIWTHFLSLSFSLFLSVCVCVCMSLVFLSLSLLFSPRLSLTLSFSLSLSLRYYVLILYCLFVLKLLVPWSQRKGMWRVLGLIMGLPFTRVTLLSAFVGDVVLSAVKVRSLSLSLSLSLYAIYFMLWTFPHQLS